MGNTSDYFYSKHFLSTNNMPNTILGTVCILPHIILTTARWGKHRYCIYSSDVENDTEFDSRTCAFNP